MCPFQSRAHISITRYVGPPVRHAKLSGCSWAFFALLRLPKCWASLRVGPRAVNRNGESPTGPYGRAPLTLVPPIPFSSPAFKNPQLCIINMLL